jgi:hypothetical protein
VPIRPVFELPPKISSATLYEMYNIAAGGYMTPVPGYAAAPTGGSMLKQPDGSVAWQAVPSGFGGQFGDGVTVLTTTGLELDLRAPFSGSIYRLVLDANIAASAVVDVRKNGVSIFGGTAVKSTLDAEDTDDEIDMADITVDFVLGDRFTIVLELVSGGPKRLTLTILAHRTG